MIHLRLKELREKAGLSQAEFAKKLSVSQSAVGMWETGKRLPEHDTLLRIARFFQVSTDYLYGHSDASAASNIHFSPAPSVSSIPIVSRVRAGFGGVVQEEFSGKEPAFGLKVPEEYRYVRVEGDSMSPKILEGDLALVHLQPDVESGELAIVILAGEEAMLKQVIKDPSNGCISLNSFNPAYPPRIIAKEHLDTLLIYGKIAGITRSF